GGGRSQSLFDSEEAAERAGARPSVGFPPRDDDLVADVLVDLAAVVVHGVRGQHEDPIEKMMDARGPEALGQPPGARDIDRQEEAMRLPWAVVPPQHPVAQRPTANDLAELEYEEEGRGGHEREDQPDDLHRAGQNREADQPRAWLVQVHERDHRAVHGRLDAERDQERRLLDRAAERRPYAEDLQGGDRRAQEQPMNRTDHRAPQWSAVDRELQNEAIGHANQRAEEHDAAKQPEPAPCARAHVIRSFCQRSVASPRATPRAPTS